MIKIRKRTNKLAFSIIIIAILVVMLFAFGSLYAVNAETNVGVTTDCANTDKYIHNGYTRDIIQYAESTIADLPSGYLYANLSDKYSNDGLYASTVKYGKASTNIMQMSASGDDPIVQIVPKDLFTTENSGIIHIGAEYGFFIKTKVLVDGAYLSTVSIFDFDNQVNDPKLKDQIRFYVKYLFQREFVYFSKDIKSIPTRNSNYDKPYMAVSKELKNFIGVDSSVVNKVLPLPYFLGIDDYIFTDIQNYYMTNIYNMISVLNEQHLNEGDKDYNVYSDKGKFVVQQDIEYCAKIHNVNENKPAEVGKAWLNVVFDVVDSALGNFIPGYSNINFFLQHALEFMSIKDYTTEIYEKQFNFDPTYVTAQGMIEEKGKLSRMAQSNLYISEDDYGEGSYLYYDKNDYFSSAYWLGYTPVENETDDSFKTPWEARIKRGFVIQFTSADDSTEVVTGGNIHDFVKKDEKEREHKDLKKDGQVVLLPNGENLFKFVPERSGNYNIRTIGAPSDINIKEISNLSKINGIDKINQNDLQLGFELVAGNEYIFAIKFDNKYDTGIFDLCIEFEPEQVNFGNNQLNLKYANNYFKFIPTKNVYYSVYLNESNCLVKLLDKDLKVIEENVINEKLLNLSLNETYYILIDKTNCTEISEIDFVIKDKKIITLENVDKVADFDKLYIHSQVDNTKLPEINVDGYIFDGWWTSLEVYGVRVTNENINDLINQPEATLYAKWTAIEYVVEYVTNGGSQIDNGKYIVEHIYELRTDTYKDGYVFYGWYDNQEFNGSKIEKIEKGSIGNKVYYAKWIQDKFIINLNVNSAFTDNIIPNISEKQFEVGYNQNYVLPVPEIKGFIFEGWVDINNTDNKFTNSNGESLDVFLIEKDIELIAKWKREEYFIGFDNNGKLSWLTQNGDEFNISNEKESIKYNPDLCPNCNVLSYLASNKNYPQTIDENFFKEGHIFTNMLIDKNDPTSIACWHTIDCDLEDGETIMLFAGHIVEKNFKLYLYVNQEQGKEPSYKKIFEGNYDDKLIFDERHFEVKSGYSLATLRVHNNTDEMYNGKYVGTHLEPGKLFYIFNSDSQTMPDLSIGIQQDGTDIYLEAFYEPNQYQVVLKADDKVECVKTVVFDTAYNTSNNNAFPISQKLGFDFKGWWTGEDGTGSCIVDENGNLVNNVWNIPSDSVLFAKFEYTKYLISFVLDGGDKIENPPLYYTMENSLELPTTKKYGYIFDGWNTGSEVIYAIPKGSTGNLILTVNWKGVLTNIYNQGEYTIQDEIAIVDFSNSGETTKLLINVDTNVKEISFIGSYEKMINKTIYVFDRTQELTMRLKDVNIVGMDNRAAIYALNCMNLNLESVGINFLQSGNITSKTRDAAALTCRDIIISGDELYITGTSANAHSGRDGLDGDAGIIGGGHRPDGIMILYIKKLECYGGNGANGLTGAQGEDKNSAPPKAEKGKPGIAGYDGGNGGKGGRGGNGGYGILFWGDIEVAFGASVKGIGGNGGNGGDGGRGGNGSRGGEGGDAVLFGASGKDGGKGGDGGRGGVYGDRGKMGVGIQYGFLTKHGDVIDHYGKNGAYGEVGAGGKGGAGGLGGWYLTGDKRHKTGANGKDGLDGGWVTIG